MILLVCGVQLPRPARGERVGARGRRRRARNCGAASNVVAWSATLRSAQRPPHPRRFAPRLLPARGEKRTRLLVLAMRLHRSRPRHAVRKPFPRPLSKKMEGGEAPKGASSRAASSDAARATRNERYHPSALRARSPFGAPPRARFGELTPPLSSSRAPWVRRHRVLPASSPIPVQRAPRRPVIVTGRAVPGAARTRVVTPRAGTAPVPLSKVPSRKAPP